LTDGCLQVSSHSSSVGHDFGGGQAVLLLAKSAFAAAPQAEMRRFAAIAAALPGVASTAACYSEQGQPSLRDALLSLRGGSHMSILIVPLVLPLEPNFCNWITRSIKRWQTEHPDTWPPIRIARDIAQSPQFAPLLKSLIEGAATLQPLLTEAACTPEGSIIPPQKRRVLVCAGGACNSAGANAIWNHLRTVQADRNLRVIGEGTMTAKATCLGPCNLAPVVQVFPEGTYYGGVTEAAIDRIVDEHLLGGKVVADFAYAPTGRKQYLRAAAPKTNPNGD